MRNFWLQHKTMPVVKAFPSKQHPEALLVEYCNIQFVEHWDDVMDCTSGQQVNPFLNIDPNFLGTLWLHAEVAALAHWIKTIDPSDSRWSKMESDFWDLVDHVV